MKRLVTFELAWTLLVQNPREEPRIHGRHVPKCAACKNLFLGTQKPDFLSGFGRKIGECVMVTKCAAGLTRSLCPL